MLSILLLSCISYFIPKIKILLAVECAAYLYFLYLIFQGKCLFLIGNQKLIDILIKFRLVYSLYYAQEKSDLFFRLDEELGYALVADRNIDGARINKQGFRGDKEYDLMPPKDKLRLAAFGDSFVFGSVFGSDEKNADIWTSYLEGMAGNLEVLNFGVPGYGLGQSYLRFLKEGLRFNADILFFNCILITNKDGIDPLEYIKVNNLRAAHCYRVQFFGGNESVLHKNTTPFDLFNKDFYAKWIYKPFGFKESSSFLSWKIFSFLNIGLLIKERVLRDYLGKLVIKREDKEKEQEEKLNVLILKDILATAHKNNLSVLFFSSNGPCN